MGVYSQLVTMMLLEASLVTTVSKALGNENVWEWENDS